MRGEQRTAGAAAVIGSAGGEMELGMVEVMGSLGSGPGWWVPSDIHSRVSQRADHWNGHASPRTPWSKGIGYRVVASAYGRGRGTKWRAVWVSAASIALFAILLLVA